MRYRQHHAEQASSALPSRELPGWARRVPTLPLALELAAARATVLSAEEQRLFAGLAVFVGGCTLEAAEQICDTDVELLAALIDKSLVRRSGERYWMLETIREYAVERQEAAEDSEDVRRRHARFYERFAAEAERGMRGPAVAAWFDRVEQDLPNLRGAIDFSLVRGESSVALRMSNALERFWQARDESEGRIWLDRALASVGGNPGERAKASLQAASLAFLRGDSALAIALYRDAIDLAHHAHDDGTRARALGFLGWALAERGTIGRRSQ